MMKLAWVLLFVVASMGAMAQKQDTMENIYSYKALASNGKEIDFKEFEGKVPHVRGVMKSRALAQRLPIASTKQYVSLLSTSRLQRYKDISYDEHVTEEMW